MTESITQTTAVGSSDPHRLKRLLHSPAALTSGGFIVMVVIACVFAGQISGHDPLTADLGATLQGPSSHHLLGTDQLGRDILSRLLHGGRLSLVYAGAVTGVALLVGIVMGLIAGFVGGWLDRVILFVTDIGLTIPVMVLIIAVLAVFRDYYAIAMVLFGIMLAPPVVRNIRGSVVAVRHELYVEAAQVAGLSSSQILVRHILPRVLGPILVQTTLIASMSLLFTVGLSYLGFGPEPPTPTWGSMVSDGSQILALSVMPLLVSGGLVGLLILAFSVSGDVIRDLTVESWSGPRRRPARMSPSLKLTDSNDDTSLLSVRGLSIAFERAGGDVAVVDGVDFTVARGEVVGLVGESGSGKTAMARALLRSLPGTGHIIEGDIQFEGRSVLALSATELRRYRGGRVSYIAQEPMASLDPTLRVGKTLAEVLRTHAVVPKARTQERVVELLRQVQIPDPERVARLYPHEISGGMAQRVAIARALAANPQLIVADEPTTALDATVQAEILKLLRQLSEQTGVSILLVSHDWGVVGELCDRAMVMYAGQLVEIGTVQDLVVSPAHPYSRALAAARPTAQTPRDLALPTIRGVVPQPGERPSGCRFSNRCDFVDAERCLTAIPLDQVVSGASGPDSPRAVRCVRHSELPTPTEEDVTNVR